MQKLTLLTENIYRLTIPFEDVYTTVFIILTPDGAVLYDTATYPKDAEQYIVPALKELDISVSSLKYIVISHDHGDHSGGLERMLHFFPDTVVISRSAALQKRFDGYKVLSPSDSDSVLNVLQIITIPGHSADCIALLDKRTRTLITGDCLQMYGLYGSGLWGSNITLPAEHLAALVKLESLEIAMLAAAHDYHPFGYLASGPEEISRCLDTCKAAIHEIRDFLNMHPDLTAEKASVLYHQSTGLPSVGAPVFEAIRTAEF